MRLYSNPNSFRRTVSTDKCRSVAELERQIISAEEVAHAEETRALAEESDRRAQEAARQRMFDLAHATSALNRARRLHRKRPKRFREGVRRLRKRLKLV